MHTLSDWLDVEQDALEALQRDVDGYLAGRYEEGRAAVERLDATEDATRAAQRAQGGSGGLWPFGRGSRCVLSAFLASPFVQLNPPQHHI